MEIVRDNIMNELQETAGQEPSPQYEEFFWGMLSDLIWEKLRVLCVSHLTL